MKSKQKFLFIVGQLGNGGLERQLHYIIKELSRDSNYKVYVYCWNYNREDFYVKAFEELLGDKLLYLNSTSRKKIFFLLKLSYAIKPDKIVSFSAFTNICVYLSKLVNFRAKTYGGLRTSYDFYIEKQGIKGFLNILFPRRIVVNSQTAIDEINRNKFLKLWKKPTLLNNIIDLSFIEQQSLKEIDSLPNFSKGINTISIGNVREAKRLDRLVELFCYVKENHLGLEIKHFHIGGGDIEDLKYQIQENDLEDYIILLGKKDNVYPFILQTDAVLHFSDVEGASNVILEGMALGKPIISTNCGDTKRYVTDNVNGWVIDEFSAEAFFERINELYNNNDVSMFISKNNKEFMQQFDVSNCKLIFQAAFND